MNRHWRRYLDKLSATHQLCGLAALNAELAEAHADTAITEAKKCRLRLNQTGELIQEARCRIE